jgi:hypothetical protein
MLRNTSVQMAAVLAAGALLGYLAASGSVNPLSRAGATSPAAQAGGVKPAEPSAGAKAACCDEVNKGQLLALANTRVAEQEQKNGTRPNILFIMGDDIGWMQPSCYHQGLMVGETPNIDRIAAEGARFVDYLAMQSCTSGRNAFVTGMYPLRTGMIPPQLPGSPSYLQPGTPCIEVEAENEQSEIGGGRRPPGKRRPVRLRPSEGAMKADQVQVSLTRECTAPDFIEVEAENEQEARDQAVRMALADGRMFGFVRDLDGDWSVGPVFHVEVEDVEVLAILDGR